VQYQAHQGRFPVAAPKNFHQTLVREDICIWFVISFCVFISLKRILALMNGTKLIKLPAGAFRFPAAAPKNCRQTLVREVICIWFVTSFCVFISSKRIRVLALMTVPSSSSYRQVSRSCSEELPSYSGSGRYLNLVLVIWFTFAYKGIRALALRSGVKLVKLPVNLLPRGSVRYILVIVLV